MPVEDIQQLIDLLALSPEVTELSVQSALGNKVIVKRQAIAPTNSELVVQEEFVETDEEDSELSMNAPVNPSVTITATMVGLFHEANPPISSGSSIATGQIVGYIESMRLMNEILSTVEGTVINVITSEGQPVEYGQPLIAVTVQ